MFNSIQHLNGIGNRFNPKPARFSGIHAQPQPQGDRVDFQHRTAGVKPLRFGSAGDSSSGDLERYVIPEQKLKALDVGATAILGRAVDRENENMITMGDEYSVQEHATVTKTGDDAYILNNLSTTQLTYVNGQIIANDIPTPIKAGDWVGLGGTYTWVVGDPEKTALYNSSPGHRIENMPLGKKVTIGRSRHMHDPELFISVRNKNSKYISRVHAEIERLSADRWAVRDLGSTNGTRINDIPLTANFEKGTKLMPDDTLALGSNTIFAYQIKRPTQFVPYEQQTPEERIKNMKVGDKLIIGRSRGPHPVNRFIEWGDDKTSREHIELKKISHNQYRLLNMGAMNGTFVNGTEVLGWKMVKPGDRIRLGETAQDLTIPNSKNNIDQYHPGVSMIHTVVHKVTDDQYFPAKIKDKRDAFLRAQEALNEYGNRFAEDIGFPIVKMQMLLPVVKMAHFTAYDISNHLLMEDYDYLKVRDEDPFKTPELFAIHEGTHGIRAAIRSLLSPEERQEAIQTALLDEIRNGKSGLMLGVKEGKLATVQPIRNLSMPRRNQLALFMQETFKNYDQSVALDDKGIPALTKTGQARLDKVLLGIGLSASSKNFTDFINQMLFRYEYFQGKTVFKDSIFIPQDKVPTFRGQPMELTNEQKAIAKQFVTETIPAFESNYILLNLKSNTKTDFMHYFGSPEEVQARMAPLELKLEQVQEAIANNKDNVTLHRRLQLEEDTIKTQCLVNELSKEWVKVQDAMTCFQSGDSEYKKLTGRFSQIENQLKQLAPKAKMEYLPEEYQGVMPSIFSA